MRRRRLDAETAARLLRGAVPPGDAPPGYADAAALLQAASGAKAEIDDARASDTVSAMAAAVTTPTPRRSTMRSKFTPKLAAAAAAGALSVAGVAAAIGGPLSAPIHGLAAAFHSDGRVVADESNPTTSTTGARNHGDCVSQAAHGFDDDHFATSSGGAFASSTEHPDNHGGDVSEAAHSDCGKKPEGKKPGDEHRGRDDRPKTTPTTAANGTTTTTARTSNRGPGNRRSNDPAPTTTSTTRPAGDDHGNHGESGDNHGNSSGSGNGSGSGNSSGSRNDHGGNNGNRGSGGGSGRGGGD